MPLLRVGNRTHIVFLTVCTQDRKKILDTNEVHDLLRAEWLKADSWVVGKYVILPDHVHLFCSPSSADAPEPKKWVKYWKAMCSRSWPIAEQQPVWQIDCWDRQLRSGENYSDKWAYVRNNPVRHGLVADSSEWPFQGELVSLEWFDR